MFSPISSVNFSVLILEGKPLHIRWKVFKLLPVDVFRRGIFKFRARHRARHNMDMGDNSNDDACKERLSPDKQGVHSRERTPRLSRRAYHESSGLNPYDVFRSGLSRVASILVADFGWLAREPRSPLVRECSTSSILKSRQPCQCHEYVSELHPSSLYKSRCW